MPETTTTIERAIDDGTIDLENGIFPLILATQGEAVDGHVLKMVCPRFFGGRFLDSRCG